MRVIVLDISGISRIINARKVWDRITALGFDLSKLDGVSERIPTLPDVGKSYTEAVAIYRAEVGEEAFAAIDPPLVRQHVITWAEERNAANMLTIIGWIKEVLPPDHGLTDAELLDFLEQGVGALGQDIAAATAAAAVTDKGAPDRPN